MEKHPAFLELIHLKNLYKIIQDDIEDTKTLKETYKKVFYKRYKEIKNTLSEMKKEKKESYPESFKHRKQIIILDTERATVSVEQYEYNIKMYDKKIELLKRQQKVIERKIKELNKE